ncbi:MAG: phosphate ABC transporter substrate-binding/OmpA family protein [Myxococcota bacterium]|jgi:NitT/TauT family transport system substrate-binding protein|nr:phosphate ABC transporter substrate-binding/OmpA family protein [Myxococcota bacterium]
MKLTPLAKVFIALVVLAVIGYVVYARFGDQLREWAGSPKPPVAGSGVAGPAQPGATTGIGKADFTGVAEAPADPGRAGVTGVATANVGEGKLGRTLVVGINTWAGHAPGIVANLGLEPNPAGLYKTRYGLDVKFVLLDDPAAKLAAFRKGDIDVMWDTVDSWAREASILAESGEKAKAILMQDWSRGGDGIVSLKTIRSIEDLRGKKIATTLFTPSHWLLLYMLAQSGLTHEERNALEKDFVVTTDAPAAAAAFKAGRVDAAVTWEPDLSGAVEARGDEAHILVSTAAATNIIADVLVARQDVVDRAPTTLRDFVHGWFDGIDQMKSDPAQSNEIVARELKLDAETVSGMLSGLKLTPFADNAQFFGLTTAKSHFDTLFNSAFVIWRKKGVVTRVIDAKDALDSRFVASLAALYPGQQVVEAAQPVAPTGTATVKPTDRAIINKQLSIHFTPNSAEIMPGSFFTLDALGETMVSFGNTYLRVEGNTDSTGARALNVALSQQRAAAVRDYLVKNFAIPESRFQAIGRGPDNPIAENTTEAGRMLNRRTDIKVVLSAE